MPFGVRWWIDMPQDGPGDPVDHELVADVAQGLVANIAPQELPLFRATAAAYFENPQRVLDSADEKDEMLGFGPGAAVALITPFALDMVSAVVGFLASQVRTAIESEAGDAITARVHA